MAVSNEELNNFNEFAKVVIAQAGERLTLDELWDQWRLEKPTVDEVRDNVRAIKAAIRDMENGDRGRPVENHIQELRKKYNLPSDA